MKTKIFTFSLMMLLTLGNVVVLNVASEGNQPNWPTTWILADTDPNESGSNDDYRDVQFAYYYYDNDYFYYRLECFGSPNFPFDKDSRYKLYLDTNDPYNMVWTGSKVYEAEFLLFVEDSPKPGGDGVGDVYLVSDFNGNGFINDDWENYLCTPGPILNKSVADYRIIDHYIDIYVSRAEIGNPIYPYFTWSTDQEDPNLDASANERSDSYCDVYLLKADLSIETSDNADPVYPGESLIYTLNVTNHGPDTAIDVCIKDILPDTVTFINAVSAQNDIISQTVWWNFTSLAVGHSEVITINVAIQNETTPGVIANNAVVYTDTFDPMPGNNEAWEYTTVCLDTDGDGIGDNADPDDDNDGYSDVNETDCDSDPLNASSVPDDFDGDFIPDCVDTDDDNDGVPDDKDAFPYDPTESQDTDGDGIGDNADPDDDNDGGSTPYTPPYENPSENNTQIVNTSSGKPSLGIGYETLVVNTSYSPLSQPIITGPSEGYIDIVYNFSIILNDSDNDIRFIINWGDGTVNESDYLAAESFFMIPHKWLQPGEYTITVSAFDGQTNATTSKVIKINIPITSGAVTPEFGNFWLLLLALMVLMWMLWFLLFGRRKDEEEEEMK